MKRKFCSPECSAKNVQRPEIQAKGVENLQKSKAGAAQLQFGALIPPAINLEDPKVVALTREMASRTLARRSLLHFTKKTHPDYHAGWVHDDICRRLQRFSQAVIDKKSPRLLLLVPPRHGKSELASIRFPAWHLGKAPSHELINVGYNLDLPMKFSRRVRELLRDPLYQSIFPAAVLDPESQSIEAWNTTAGGGLQSAGVGGGITGKGAHILIVDDPLKNMEEADSALIRDNLWDWFLSTAYTRLSPGGGVLIIETWWNDDDLAGRLQAAMKAEVEADQYEIIKYPATAEQYEYRDLETLVIERSDEVPTEEQLAAHRMRRALRVEQPLKVSETRELLRAPGDALHPARYDEVALRRIKMNQAPRIWSALYQQNPVPDEGLYFHKDYLRTAPNIPPPYGLHVYTAWDFAIGEKQQNDWTVGATLIQDQQDMWYVVEIVRFKADSFTIIEEMLNAAQRWGSRPDVGYLMGAEDGQIWRSIEPLLKKRMQERSLYPACEILRPLTDKLARARALQGRMQQGRVYFPAAAPWMPVVTQELLRFPGAAHDDIVDALAWAANMIVGKAAPKSRIEAELKGWRDKMEESFGGAECSHMAA